ncbi:MAG: AAA family ATPase [Phormidesmis sp.]
MSWKYFKGNQAAPAPLTKLPERPPWRDFLLTSEVDKDADDLYWQSLRKLVSPTDRAFQRGRSFRIQLEEGHSDVIDAVNAAIHLRRPLLVTGAPGSGKTSLAYAIAYELALGPVLAWPVTAKSNLTDALYQYDAIARLQDAQLDKTREAGNAGSDTSGEDDLGDYIQLGPVGTAFLPSRLPRVLLIDEIDKSDLNLPNDLLNLFEEGEFEIPELVRRKRKSKKQKKVHSQTVSVLTADKDMAEKPITNGRVRCCEFPITIMTSNGERDFPPAFYRRCLRLTMPNPTAESLMPIVESHFKKTEQTAEHSSEETNWSKAEEKLGDVINEFLGKENRADRATDQLLNAIYLMTRKESPSEADMVRLKKLLFKQLSELS